MTKTIKEGAQVERTKWNKIAKVTAGYGESIWKTITNDPSANTCWVNTGDVWTALAVKHFGLKVPIHLISPISIIETKGKVTLFLNYRLPDNTKDLLNENSFLSIIWETPHSTIISFETPER